MEYKPKVITGKVTGTGWPIDGHVLWFSQWDYDNRESWHLYGWEDSEDEAVMQTVFQTISIHALRVEGDSKNRQSFRLFLRKREKNLPL